MPLVRVAGVILADLLMRTPLHQQEGYIGRRVRRDYIVPLLSRG